jgi:hypothetical protein
MMASVWDGCCERWEEWSGTKRERTHGSETRRLDDVIMEGGREEEEAMRWGSEGRPSGPVTDKVIR